MNTTQIPKPSTTRKKGPRSTVTTATSGDKRKRGHSQSNGAAQVAADAVHAEPANKKAKNATSNPSKRQTLAAQRKLPPTAPTTPAASAGRLSTAPAGRTVSINSEKPRMIQGQRKHAPPQIDVDKSSSEGEKLPSAVTTVNQTRNAREENEENYDEDGEEKAGNTGEDDDGSEYNEPRETRVDMVNFINEAVSIVKPARAVDAQQRKPKQRLDPGHHRCAASTCSDSVRSAPDGPPTTDDDFAPSDGVLEALDQDEGEDLDTRSPSPSASLKNLVPSNPRKPSQREQKLASELPLVTESKKRLDKDNKTMAGARGKTRALSESGSDTDSAAHPWMPRTDISRGLKRQSANTWSLLIKPLGHEMKSVIHASYDLGRAFVAMGDGTVFSNADESDTMTTPFGGQGITSIAHDALIAAADDLGYGGEYDIADRLENGSKRHYITPLSSYVSFKFTHACIKQAAAHVYPSAIKLSTLPPAKVKELRESSNFLYPLNAQPFSGPGIIDVIQAAFYAEAPPNNVGTLNIARLSSSLQAAPQELEIPDVTLAVAATAIHAVLNDHINPPVDGKPSEFGGIILENAFRAYMRILIAFRLNNTGAYHQLMHKIAMSVTGGRAVNTHGDATQADILSRVDWDNIGA
ncbi:hypothetical protein FKP32DRAFT_1602235 [Trametes sanguinea]|nr:hypothetical protein FKP32DRAFT_1602235 [Trametes sanguinea]